MAVYDKIKARPGNPYLIPSLVHPGEHISIYAIEDAWQRVRAAAGVEDVRLMDLRHTFASVAAGEGETLMMIGAILGHTNPATTMRYAHLVGGPVRAGSERVAKKIEAAMGRRRGR
jgi:integrase